ncbi:MAG: B12-binding domain-containing radical SAM protein [Acidobacteriota bacterium]
MDILLTHGYFLRHDPHELKVMKPYPPLGLLHLSSYLKAKGFDVAVFDSTFSSGSAFEEFMRRERPSIVGFYCNLMNRKRVFELIAICRETGAIVVVGGPEPANYPEEYLARGADVVVVGEGELTLEELVPHLVGRGPRSMHRIRGLVYREEDGALVRTEPRPFIRDLDSLPFPDREAVDIHRYVRVWREHHGRGSVSLITSRGCPYTCTWCSHGVFGYSHRGRSPRHVADEVELIREEYEPDMLWYADDVFTLNPRWFSAYAEELKRRDLLIPFETISREDRLDEEIIRTLAELRCFRLWIGAESGSQRILDAMKRRTNAARVREMVRMLQRYGIEAGLFVMLGYEGEELSDLEETVGHLKAANPDVFLTTVAYPIKGTPYFEQVETRVIASKTFETSSDRDLTVAGRHSQRFYRFANRWMVSEVAFHKQWDSRPNYPRALKAFASAKIGRLGMWATRHETEGA